MVKDAISVIGSLTSDFWKTQPDECLRASSSAADIDSLLL